ncbi:MAG: ubiquitin-like protein Pup [Actinomycetales bacterium]
MSGQEQQRPNRRDGDEPDDAPAPPPGAAQVDTSDVDDLLDEIDDVLEENSESFVRGFIQKGGQ